MIPFLPNLPALWDMFYLPPPTPLPNLLYSTLSTRRLAFMENTNRFLCHLAWLALANGGTAKRSKNGKTMSLGCLFLSPAPCCHHLPEAGGLQAVLSSSPSSGGSTDYHFTFHFTPESTITFLSLLTSVCSNISPWFCLTLLTSF